MHLPRWEQRVFLPKATGMDGWRIQEGGRRVRWHLESWDFLPNVSIQWEPYGFCLPDTHPSTSPGNAFLIWGPLPHSHWCSSGDPLLVSRCAHATNYSSIRAKPGTSTGLSENVHSVSTEAADVADIRQHCWPTAWPSVGRSLPDTDIRTEESRAKGEKQVLGDISKHLDPTIPESRIP